MKKEAIGTNGILVILFLALAFTFTVFIAIGSAEITELKVNPEVVIQGANVSLSGRAAPNETVWITSSFVISLPVSDGKYTAEFIDILFPPGEKKFSVTAENVVDIRISLDPLFSLKIEYPLDGPLEATNGTATIAISVPFTMWGITVIDIRGEKDVTVYGNAAEDAEFVNLSVDMSVKVIADSTVTYCYNVSNTGNVSLANISVIDDCYGLVTVGTTALSPGESTSGTLTHTVTESGMASVASIVTVNATDPLGMTVTDTDACIINTEILAGINIEKTASLTGVCPGLDQLIVQIGDNVTYCYNVSNTGNVSLTNISVIDDIYGPVTLGTTSLSPGESISRTLTHTVTGSDILFVASIVTVNATDPLGGTVIDTDACMINTEILAGINIEKTAYMEGTCPGSDPLIVLFGDFKLDVNTGGVPLGEFMITAGAINKTVEVVSIKHVFDTGMSEDPYPCMCGTHNGTITPNQTITVSKLYTYSCPGTCGHTERVTIWNDMGVIVEANWTGYRGDWCNITFDAVTLVAGATYNYSFCTGSYPQIIHERTASVTGGAITCTQFTDANGNVYIDWIPAIILY